MDHQPPKRVTLGKDGDVTLPRVIREAARLAPGSRLIVTTTVDRAIEIRSADLVRARAWSLCRKHGLDA